MGYHSKICRMSLICFLLVSVFQAAPIYEKKDAADRKSRRSAVLSSGPNFGIEVHKINNLFLAITNGGSFGNYFAGTDIDPETGLPAPSCEYPANSDVTYLYKAGLWAGAVVGTDTLVTVGTDGNYNVQEFWPLSGDEGTIVRRSRLRSSTDYSPDAVSEQDFICTYYDTLAEAAITGTDSRDNRPHIPLGLEVQQRSYGWSYEYAQDFIIFDFTIKNINRYPLRQVYFGIYVDADIYHESNSSGSSYTDDICGYLHSYPSQVTQCQDDTVRIAWTADNNGDPDSEAGNTFSYRSATSLTGTTILRTPNPDLQYSFNWWVTNDNVEMDWGPRMASTEERPYRDFGTGMGSPRGDRNKYYMLSTPAFDYDQLESAVNHADDGFLPPDVQNAANYADGFDARYLLSFGPFDLEIGDTLPITMAYVAGENFHNDPNAFNSLWDPYYPQAFIDQLNFNDLTSNTRWANFIYDNPGYDSNNDGDSGRYFWEVKINDVTYCFREDNTTATGPDDYPLLPDSLRNIADKVYYLGDGIPDFRGAAPPPSPVLNVISGYGTLKIRWNGQNTENDVDFFSGSKDFEGYRVYLGNDNRASDYVLMSEYDLDNFNIYIWQATTTNWEITGEPLLRETLQEMYGDNFNPDIYTSPENSFSHESGNYYFVPQGYNASDLTDDKGIHKVYPQARKDNPSDTTSEGYLRYYEYEYGVTGLLPSVPYYVSVTAFDFGDRKYDLSALESAFSNNEVLAYALSGTDEVEERGLKVQVYPNPYRIDGGYAAAGFENRDRTKSAERSRSINFFNLPSVCTIRIFTVDGDLVDEIHHDRPDAGPDAQLERWDIISRNTQEVVTGIYIYHVESALGDQIGKIVIIK